MYREKKIVPRRKQNSVIIGTSEDTWNQVDLDNKNDLKRQVIERDGLFCNTKNKFGCGARKTEGELEMDHIIAISMGGPICDISNIQLLCRGCHTKKTEKFDNRQIEDRVSIRIGNRGLKF